MRFGRLLGMGSGSSKPAETSTQPGGSRTAQFLQKEGIPKNFPIRTFAIPAHATESRIQNSPSVTTRGGDSSWDPYTPTAELPERKRSKFPWKKSSISKAPSEQTPGYFADSRPSSVIDIGSEGITPGSFVFSEPSPASSVSSPPTSPFSFNNVRRKPIGLRPAASSPNLLASTSSRPYVSPTKRAQNNSNLPSLWETPAPPRRRRGSDVESAYTASPFGAGTSLEEPRNLSPIPYRPRDSNATTLSNNEQLQADANEIINMEEDIDLAMALSESEVTPHQPKDTRRPSSPAAPAVLRSPSPTPSDSSDDLVLYRGRDNIQPRTSTQSASIPPPVPSQEQMDLELAQIMQREEEERALSYASSSRRPPRFNTFVPPPFPSSSSGSSRKLHPNNPFTQPSFRNTPRNDLLHNPWSKAPSSRRALDPDELLARQLQDEENRGVPKHVSRPQEDIDLAIAMQLADEENQRLREMNATPSTRDCAVCAESIPIPELPALMNCEHEPQVCKDCYQGWIASELNSKSWKEIKCPETGCKELLHHAEVQQYAAPDVYAKFDALSAREALNDDPNFRWCRGPNCKSGQIHESDVSGNIFQCIACDFKVCTVHEGPWHEGETCEEYDYRTSGRKEKDQKAQEAASLAAISKLTKKCPGKGGKCGWAIEKNDGCDHMTCTKCKYQFCWICMADYQPIRDKGNSEHAESCTYHSSRLPTLPAEQAV